MLQNMIDEGAIETFGYRGVITGHDYWFSMQNSGNSFRSHMHMIPISPGFCDVTHQEEFLQIGAMPSYKNKKYNKMSFCDQLYLNENLPKVGISGYHTWDINLTINDDYWLRFRHVRKNIDFSIMTQPAFVITSASGLVMSNQPSLLEKRTTVINFKMATDLLNKCRLSETVFTFSTDYEYDNILIQGIYLKINTTIPIKKAINIITTEAAKYSSPFNPWFYFSFNETFTEISSMVLFRYNSLIIVVLFLCFFNMSAVMTININPQQKEIAILRAIGMKSIHIIFVFIGEPIVLIMTYSIIGTTIGYLLSSTMYLQYEGFTLIPVRFSMQIVTVCVLILFYVLGGILSIIIPSIQMMRIPIAELIKNN